MQDNEVAYRRPAWLAQLTVLRTSLLRGHGAKKVLQRFLLQQPIGRQLLNGSGPTFSMTRRPRLEIFDPGLRMITFFPCQFKVQVSSFL